MRSDGGGGGEVDVGKEKTTTIEKADNDDAVNNGQVTVEDVFAQMKHDKKYIPTSSTSSFLVTAFLGVPIWLSVLLPLGIVYQTVGKAVFGANGDATTTEEEEMEDDDVLQSFPSIDEIKPMEKRKYDLVLLGATGYTGKLAALYLAKEYGVGNDVKWSLAGRSQSKLDKVKADIAKELGNDDVLSVDTIIVDTSKRSTLHQLVDDTKSVVTTAGPFAKYGSPVVEFCSRYGTHYTDITGEVDWVKQMIMKYDTIAQSTGAKIISLCGHDSIPWDLSVYKLSQLLQDEGDELSEVECFDYINTNPSGGTAATALNIIDGNVKTPNYEFNPLLKKADGSKSLIKTKSANPMMMGKTSEGQWTAPFLMADVNAQTVTRSNALMNKQGNNNNGNKQLITYRESQLMNDFKSAFVFWMTLTIGGTALLNPLTRRPIEKYVLPKPGEGPSAKQLSKGFLLIHAFGKGVKGTKVEGALYFPKDPGYVETARMVVESALCLARDTKKLPTKGGGFFSPAIGMGDALLDRLIEGGTMFASRVISKGDGKKLLSKL